MKLVRLQTLCFVTLWVSVAPNHRGAVMYGLSQAEAQGLPLKSGFSKGLQLAASTITSPPPTHDNFYHDGGSENPRPCKTKNNNGYNIFLRRHVRNDIPENQDKEAWKTFFANNQELCNRPTQSFLRYQDKIRIENVCSTTGGKIYDKNLCISNNKFSFITVQLNSGCEISNITIENKHIILACDIVDNLCKPVHFEQNPNNQRPDSRAKGCE